MGGGQYNGKNHGGEHTGCGKKANGGPYSNDGYRPDPDMSHLDFEEGNEVIYGGSNKYKQKNDIPNGCRGMIMEKDNLQNKLQKTSRSLLKVDFGDHGYRFVRKELLQHVGSCINNQEAILETTDREPLQEDRNDKKKVVKGKLESKKYQKTLANRKKIKEFREWRKGYLDDKKLELQIKANNQHDEPVYKQKKERRAKIQKGVDELVEKYDNEIVYKTEFIMDAKKDLTGPTEEVNRLATKAYNQEKEKDGLQMKYFKKELGLLKEFFDDSNQEYKELVQVIGDGSRRFIRNVASKEDYNKFLHFEYEKEGNKEYKYEEHEYKPSREYKVDDTVKATESDEINLLQWGLYPHQVC